MGHRLREIARVAGVRGARDDERGLRLVIGEARHAGDPRGARRSRRSAAAATPLPLNVDSERCFPDDPGGVAETVRLLAEAGAAGCSIEDFNPATGEIEALELAAERVSVAAGRELVLTARAENHLHGSTTSKTLSPASARTATPARTPSTRRGCATSSRSEPSSRRWVLRSTCSLSRAGRACPSSPRSGVRRVSTGSLLAGSAYGALLVGAGELLGEGTSSYAETGASRDALRAAFEPG